MSKVVAEYESSYEVDLNKRRMLLAMKYTGCKNPIEAIEIVVSKMILEYADPADIDAFLEKKCES